MIFVRITESHYATVLSHVNLQRLGIEIATFYVTYGIMNQKDLIYYSKILDSEFPASRARRGNFDTAV